jgi:hypothetical protein
MANTKSGTYWVTWAKTNATDDSNSIDDLVEPFKTNVKDFIKALEDAGATKNVSATLRDAKKAYLFHWSWKIALDKCKPSDATAKTGVDIEWDHGDAAKSKAGAQEMVDGFGLAVPPKSTEAPSLTSNHIAGKAIDMTITWTGDLKVKNKDGTVATVPFNDDVNKNTLLHDVGATYSVKKLKTDAPHWSFDGK